VGKVSYQAVHGNGGQETDGSKVHKSTADAMKIVHSIDIAHLRDVDRRMRAGYLPVIVIAAD
jgi:hypothetical protein